MKHLLSKRNAGLLARFARSRVLLAFDFDGTLAPIVKEPSAARMRERTRELFERVSRLYPCVVISGRDGKDVSRRLGGARLARIVGNHGVEGVTGAAAFARETADARRRLARALSSVAGVEIEDKRFSLSIHYRRSRRKSEARRAILDAVGRLPRAMRVIPGKSVVNVLPASAPDKGDALLRLRSTQRAERALFVGDDVTDEDIFRLDQPGRLLAIRIGRSSRSSAGYYLRDQREMDPFLESLVAMRAGRNGFRVSGA